MSLRRLLLPLLLLCLSLPASANLFDQRPAASPLGAPLNNSSDFLPVREAFKLSLVSSDVQSVTLRFVAAEGYYLYRHRLNFSVEPAGFDLGEAQLPAGKAKHDEFFGDVEVYYGVLDVRLPLDNPDNRPLRLQVGYQGCADKGLCYPPETEYIEIGEMPASVADLQKSEWTWKDLALFFLAGLGLTFTPCVLPMLPILSGVVLRGRPSNARGLVLSLAYVLPMAACYAVLGALMGLFGAGLNLQAMLQSPWVLVPFAAFFGLFAMAMFGVFELRLPAFIRDRLDQRASQTRGGTIAGAATLGVLSSLIVSPCITAPLTALLLYISSTGDAVGGGRRHRPAGQGGGLPRQRMEQLRPHRQAPAGGAGGPAWRARRALPCDSVGLAAAQGVPASGGCAVRRRLCRAGQLRVVHVVECPRHRTVDQARRARRRRGVRAVHPAGKDRSAFAEGPGGGCHRNPRQPGVRERRSAAGDCGCGGRRSGSAPARARRGQRTLRPRRGPRGQAASRPSSSRSTSVVCSPSIGGGRGATTGVPLMRTGEASIGVLWNTRAKVLQEETKGKLTFTWNQGILQPAAFPILKGNPAGSLAQHFIASCCANVDAQVGLLGFFANGPTNPRAAEKVPADLKKYNPTDPANAKVQLIFDGEWWGKNYTEVNQQYLDTIAS